MDPKSLAGRLIVASVWDSSIVCEKRQGGHGEMVHRRHKPAGWLTMACTESSTGRKPN